MSFPVVFNDYFCYDSFEFDDENVLVDEGFTITGFNNGYGFPYLPRDQGKRMSGSSGSYGGGDTYLPPGDDSRKCFNIITGVSP